MSHETLDSIVAQGFDTLRYSTHRFLKPVSLEPFAALKGKLREGLAKIRETKIESWATPSGDIVVLRNVD
jgi:hypothetical protein